MAVVSSKKVGYGKLVAGGVDIGDDTKCAAHTSFSRPVSWVTSRTEMGVPLTRIRSVKSRR